MRTVVVQVSEHRYEVHERNEDGPIIGVFTTPHDAALFVHAYSNGRY